MEIIDFHGHKRPAAYLGDGVYVIYDGLGYWLHANDHAHPTDRICLDVEVFDALMEFRRELEQNIEEIGKLCSSPTEGEKDDI